MIHAGRLRRTAPVLGLWAACLLLHWRGFQSWFRADDLAWMQLGAQVHDFGTFLSALFRPLAEGTVRPWSERALFLGGYAWFGLDPLPFHLLVYATQFANLALMTWIGARLTDSRAAAYLAALLWILHSATVEPLAWISAYNQVLCAFFLLAALAFFIRFGDYGKRRHQIGLWAAFLLGFGAHETMFVFPVIAAIYAVLFMPWLVRRTAPMFAVSGLYLFWHAAVTPFQQTGEYAMHFTGAVFRTMARYWLWSAGPSYGWTPVNAPVWIVGAAALVLTAALAAFGLSRLTEGRIAPLFCVAWYALTILPVLPLRDHRMDYYLFIPVIGICWLGGWALAEACEGRARVRAAGASLLALYLLLMAPRTLAASDYNYRVSMRVRGLMGGLARIHQIHPAKTLALDGVDQELFWNCIVEKPGPLVGISKIYLTPDSDRRIGGQSSETGPAEFVLPAGVARAALQRDDLVVYDVRRTPLRNITADFAAKVEAAGLPTRIDAGDPLDAQFLGPEWYPIDGNHRWMPARATLRIGGPDRPGRRLWLTGTRPDSRPAAITVTANGVELPAEELPPQDSFALSFPISGTPKTIDLKIEVSRTVRVPGDARELGLAFGVIDIR